MRDVSLTVEGMHCEHCVASVTKALEALPSVSDVQVSLAEGQATLKAGNFASDEALIAAIEEAGFTAQVRA